MVYDKFFDKQADRKTRLPVIKNVILKGKIVKFDNKASHGKAGEFYFAYWVCNYFGWPCRLLDIDVGIDAQIEIFDESNHSSGLFIGAQVKTNQTNDPDIQVKLNNLKYWSSIEDPIVLISITLADGPKIYWKLINDSNISSYIKRAESNKSNKVLINFNEEDELTIFNKQCFRDLIYMKQATCLDQLCLKFNESCEELDILLTVNDEIRPDPVSLNIDIVGLEHYLSHFDSLFEQFDKVESLIKSNSKLQDLSINYLGTQRRYKTIHSYISEFVGYVKDIDIDYGFEIRDQWFTPDTNKKLLKIFEDKYQ